VATKLLADGLGGPTVVSHVRRALRRVSNHLLLLKKVEEPAVGDCAAYDAFVPMLNAQPFLDGLL
jgi:hypothetical protein